MRACGCAEHEHPSPTPAEDHDMASSWQRLMEHTPKWGIPVVRPRAGHASGRGFHLFLGNDGEHASTPTMKTASAVVC
eukprot:7632545-Alexandrium_andersonii.AAC.1